MNNREIELITVDELCDLLQCGYSTAYKLLSENKLKAFRLGRIWKIPREGVYEYISTQSGLTTSDDPFA